MARDLIPCWDTLLHYESIMMPYVIKCSIQMSNRPQAILGLWHLCRVNCSNGSFSLHDILTWKRERIIVTESKVQISVLRLEITLFNYESCPPFSLF